MGKRLGEGRRRRRRRKVYSRLTQGGGAGRGGRFVQS
jgi:hypothetical protein